MKYLKKIGNNARKAFEDLKEVKHEKIKKVLNDYNKALLKNTNKIIYENKRDVRNVKRKQLVDRLILNKKRIAVANIPNIGLGKTINDRLKRGAKNN